MSSFNKVILMGNLTRDPELRTLPSGAEVCEFTLAVNEKYKGKEEVSFIDCAAWNKVAETVSNYKKKGDSIIVEGKLKQESWVDKQSGQKRSKLKITVMSVTFVGGKSEAAPKADNAGYGGNQGAGNYAQELPAEPDF